MSQCSERMNVLVSFHFVTLLGIDVTEWFNFMPNWTLLSHLYFGCFFKKNATSFSFLPAGFSLVFYIFSCIAVHQHFNISFEPLSLGCRSYFPVLNFIRTRNSSVKTDIHLKGFKDIPAAWLQEAAFMKNFIVTDRREALLWFFFPFSKHNMDRSELMAQIRDDIDFKKFSCFQIGLSGLCKYGR